VRDASITAILFTAYRQNRRRFVFYSSVRNYYPTTITVNYGDTAINNLACKWIVGVLRIAADHDCEEKLGDELSTLIHNDNPLPALKVLQERYLGGKPVPIIPERQQDLASYDHLLQGGWHLREEVSHA
jgi:ribosomal protein S7